MLVKENSRNNPPFIIATKIKNLGISLINKTDLYNKNDMMLMKETIVYNHTTLNVPELI